MDCWILGTTTVNARGGAGRQAGNLPLRRLRGEHTSVLDRPNQRWASPFVTPARPRARSRPPRVASTYLVPAPGASSRPHPGLRTSAQPSQPLSPRGRRPALGSLSWKPRPSSPGMKRKWRHTRAGVSSAVSSLRRSARRDGSGRPWAGSGESGVKVREGGWSPGTGLGRLPSRRAVPPGRAVRMRLARPRRRRGRRYPPGTAVDPRGEGVRGVFVSSVQATWVTFLLKGTQFCCWE